MRRARRTIRYAVVGQGYIAQAAVLPAFANAAQNSELVALVSHDPEKLSKLSRKYGNPRTYLYEQFDECLASGVDAVFIALPNSMHRRFTLRAAEAGVHVLCEKPIAVAAHEAEQMVRACEEAGVKLMVAYRLHFEAANLDAVEQVRSGRLGRPRLFTSTFTMKVDPSNIRMRRDLGGGPLRDIGIYCINAARMLFQSEPFEATAVAIQPDTPPFEEVEEAVSAVLRFPDDRLASFTCSFGASDVSSYHVTGTKGALHMSPAYGFSETLRRELTVGDRKRTKKFPRRDQFGPELLYFSDCILQDNEPEPSGWEGLADLRVIEAIETSIREMRPAPIASVERDRRPSISQELRRPPVAEPRLVNAASPHDGG